MTDDQRTHTQTVLMREFSCYMSDGLAKQLNSVANDMSMTKESVFTRAIGLYKKSTEAIASGGRVLIEDIDGNVVELRGIVPPRGR